MKFFLNKQELENIFGIETIFDELIHVILLLFYVSMQDFIDIRTVKNTGDLYELFLRYGSKHDTDSEPQ